jgi:hypothetical protein
MEAMLTRHGSSSHLRLTKSVLAKQQRKVALPPDEQVSW